MNTFSKQLSIIKKQYIKYQYDNIKTLNKKIRFIVGIVDHYSKYLNMSKDDILLKFEKTRNTNIENYYNKYNLKKLKNVEIFENINDFNNKFSSNKFICPTCNTISDSKFICSKKHIRCIPKNYFYLIKSESIFCIHSIFKPLELYQI